MCGGSGVNVCVCVCVWEVWCTKVLCVVIKIFFNVIKYAPRKPKWWKFS